MYEELVKQLRDNAEFLVKASSGRLSNSFAETMIQAADAIEELSKREADISHNMAALSLRVLREEEKTPRWIPVTERLPEENEPWYIIQEIKDDADYDNMQRLVNLVHVYEKCKEEVDNAKDQPTP